MRFVGVVADPAMVKTRELHTFECPNCRRTEQRLAFAHSIGTFPSERMQLTSTALPMVKPAMYKIVIVSRSAWTCMILTFCHSIFSASV
jgi:hypothetical protein